MNQDPKRHHFIPESYQKGFCNESGELFAYKKTYGNIKSWKPAQILYEMGLHTIKIRKEQTLIIERFYSSIEDEFSKYIKLIVENIGNKEKSQVIITDLNFLRVAKTLIATQFWRTPCKKDLALKYSSKLIELYDKSDNEVKEILNYDRKFIKHISKRANKGDTIKIIQFLLLPLLSFDIYKEEEKFGFYIAGEGNVFFSSDRPVIYNNIEKLFSFQSFLFPFSKELVLFGTERDIISIDVNKTNALIKERALEVVISGSKEKLLQLRDPS